MDDISTINRSSGEILSVNGSVVTLSHPSIITLSAAKENVVLFVREGRNLVVALKSGGKIILVDFYPETGEDSDNVLVIKDEDGALWWVEHPGAAFQYTTLLPDIESLMLPQDNSSIASGLVGFTGLGGGLAGLAALASRGEGSRLTNNSDSGSEGGAGSDSDSDAEGGAGSDSDSEGGSGSDSDSDAEGGAGSDSDSDSDSDAEGGSDSDSDSDSEGGSGSDSDSDAEGGAGSDSDSDSDSEGGIGLRQ
ncbi:BapA/Bap/LapF family prefix-like domain-containing protein [Edwardsiella anguillarum]|uniref:BapA/Bap/LapF family prefix-like domain-containing protein n=1 Tax=Edwardsiella anguillarum TaxID=1821960 RepID=UPI003D1CFC80